MDCGSEGTAAADRALEHFLLTLYRAGREASVGSFQDWCFTAIRALFPFAGGFWSRTALEGGNVVLYGIHRYNLPPELERAWEPVKGHDVIGKMAYASPGRTISLVAREVISEPVVLERIVAAYGLEHMMATCLVDPLTSLVSVVAVIRGAEGPPFSEAERRMKERVMPHLIEAYGINRLIHLMATRQQEGRLNYATAACDGDALLHVVSAEFATLLREEWPAWRGPRLPTALVKALDQPVIPVFRGSSLVVRFESVNELIWLRARRKGSADDLSPREAEVARLSAAGRTNKVIGQVLGSSPFTVRNQLAVIYGKLGIGSRTELAAWLSELDY